MTSIHLAATFYFLEIDTSAFAFRAFGRTPDETRDLLRQAWVIHCRQTGADPDWLETDIAEATPRAITVPSGYRDDSLLADGPVRA